MCDLGISRLVSLAVGMGAHPDFDIAIGSEPHIGLLVAGNDRTSPGGED